MLRLARSPATAPRLAVVGAALLFSSGGAGIKACSLDGWHVAGLRSAIAALALALLFPAARRGWSRRTVAVGAAFATTLILFVLGNKLTTAANTIFLQSAAPLHLMLLAPWLLGERLRLRDAAPMIAFALGLALFHVEAPSASLSAPRPLLGNAIATASGVAWALTLAGLRALERSPGSAGDGLRSVLVGNVLAAAVCAGPMLARPEAAMASVDLALVAYLGIVQIGAAYALLTFGLRTVGAFEGSLLILVEPAASPLWTWWLHDERPGPFIVAGGLLILGASAAKAWLESRSPAADSPADE